MRIARVGLSLLCLSLSCSTASTAPPAASAEATAEGPRTVPFELGATELADGDAIRIDRIEGGDQLRVGETYTVFGTYTLASRDRAQLVVSITTTADHADAPWGGTRIDIERGEDTFALPVTLTTPGKLHVTMYDAATGRPFSGVYFGHDAWLLHEKSWSYAGR